MWATIRNRDWRIASLFVALLLSSCNTYHDMYGNKYSAAGGDGDVTFPGGGHMTYSNTASFQHFMQGVTTIVGGIATAEVSKALNASNAATTQQANAQSAALAAQKETDAANAAAAALKASQQASARAAGAPALIK